MSLNLSTLTSLINSTFLSSRTNGTIVGYKWSDYLILILSSCGALTNAINIAVFVNPRLKDITFRYMLVKLIIVLLYYLFTILTTIFVSCSFCLHTFTLFASFYSIAISFYLSSSLVVMRILIEITISLRILTILNNRAYCNRISYKLIVGLVVLAGLVFYLDRPFSYYIISLNHFDIHYLNYTYFAISRFAEILSIAKEMIRVLLTVVVLTIINLFNLVKFRTRFKKRRIEAARTTSMGIQNPIMAKTSGTFTQKSLDVKQQQSQITIQTVTADPAQNVERNEATRSITKMVIISSFIRILCEIPYVIGFSMVASGRPSEFANNFFFASASLVYVPPLCDIFVYYFFNKNFKSVLKNYLKCSTRKRVSS